MIIQNEQNRPINLLKTLYQKAMVNVKKEYQHTRVILPSIHKVQPRIKQNQEIKNDICKYKNYSVHLQSHKSLGKNINIIKSPKNIVDTNISLDDGTSLKIISYSSKNVLLLIDKQIKQERNNKEYISPKEKNRKFKFNSLQF